MSFEDVNRKSTSPTDERSSVRWRVRPMRHEDIEKCLQIWLQVELTEAHQTVASSLESDPDGFYVAELEPTGEVIGMCAGTFTRQDTAFMGFYAVELDYQGIGVGRQLWATTMKRLDEFTNIGLYGVPAMSEKYKKSGFHVEDTVRMLIFESQPAQELRLDLLASFDDLSSKQDLELHVITPKTDELIIRKLVDFDCSVNKFSREKLLRNYLASEANAPLTLALVRKRCKQVDVVDNLPSCCAKQPKVATAADQDEQANQLSRQLSGSLKLASSSSRNGCAQEAEAEAEVGGSGSDLELLAYGCIRHDNTGGGMIGPVYAESNEACQVILRRLLERFEFASSVGKYSAMSLTSNKRAGEMLTRVGLREMDQCSRMFTKFVPEAQADKVYFIHSPNFTLF